MVAIPASERQEQADSGGCLDCQVSQLGELGAREKYCLK